MDGVYSNLLHGPAVNLIDNIDPSWHTDSLADEILDIPIEDSQELVSLINEKQQLNNPSASAAATANNNNNPDDDSNMLPINVASVLAAGTIHHEQFAAKNQLISHNYNPATNSSMLNQQQKLKLLDEKWTELALQQFLQDGIIRKTHTEQDKKSM
jgi:hypothetical protein